MSLTRGRQRIKVDYLARVEGEGGLELELSDGQIVRLQLNIFEPPRLFEAFLAGRSYDELPDITARICGICPVAYQMSAVHAAEDAFGVRVGGQLRQLRRLLYCGEWIESHLLHVYLLAAPDFLGYPDTFAMATDYPEQVKAGLRMKRIGNDLVALLGGREIHPVSAAVGGFTRVPMKEELLPLLEPLKWGKEQAIKGVAWLAGLPLPDLTRDVEFVALSHPDEYAMIEGRMVSSKGLNVAIAEFEGQIEPRQLPYSSALRYTLKGRGAYFVGPLARVSLNFDRLAPDAQLAARDSGIPFPNSNPFASIVARMVEVVHAMDEAARIIEGYERPSPRVEVQPRAERGYGITEAPRGSLYHSYLFDEGGLVRSARIITPTAQNQQQIEEDLHHYLPRLLHRSREEITLQCEMAIRNYDPCISCATH